MMQWHHIILKDFSVVVFCRGYSWTWLMYYQSFRCFESFLLKVILQSIKSSIPKLCRWFVYALGQRNLEQPRLPLICCSNYQVQLFSFLFSLCMHMCMKTPKASLHHGLLWEPVRKCNPHALKRLLRHYCCLLAMCLLKSSLMEQSTNQESFVSAAFYHFTLEISYLQTLSTSSSREMDPAACLKCQDIIALLDWTGEFRRGSSIQDALMENILTPLPWPPS